MDRFTNALLGKKLESCKQCGTRYQYKSMGEYECPSCGFIEMDDYGKVRSYIEKNGPSSAIIISAGTGLPVEVITRFLREGRVEIPNGSVAYIKCERCGVADIRFGKYCPSCAAELSKKIKGTLNAAEVGDVPKHQQGKMRYFEKKK